MAVITLVGLGSGGIGQLTLESWEALQNGRVFLRTAVHPCAQDLKARGIDFQSYDRFYEQAEDFERVYAAIADDLIAQARRGDLVYAVPGNPFFAESTVALLLEKAKEAGVTVRALPAVSFVDSCLTALQTDGGQGLTVIDAFDLIQSRPDATRPLLITQPYSRPMLSDIKLSLMNVYPDDFRTALIIHAGLPDESVVWMPLYELDRHEPDHLCSVYVPALEEDLGDFSAAEAITRRLRLPGGCPWDREQTHDSLRRYLLEEAYEVLEAIDNRDSENLKEELGDLLYQVFIHAQIADEEGLFDIHDVIRGINEKMIRRHPHVFADAEADSSAAVTENWEAIKKQEKGTASFSEAMDQIPESFTALMKADKIQSRAKKAGFDWDAPLPALDKVAEETQEVREVLTDSAENGVHLKEEVGDLLFAVVNTARLCGIDSEEALREANAKFVRRFKTMEHLAGERGKSLTDYTLDGLEELWQQAKTCSTGEQL